MRLPDTVAEPPEKSTVAFRMVAVPVVAPMVRVVAALAKLTVVAVVSTRSKEEEPVVREVVMAGEVPNTDTPVPVSSVRALRRSADAPDAATFEDESVNNALEAVKPVNVTVLDALSVPVISSVVAGAVLPIPTFPEFARKR